MKTRRPFLLKPFQRPSSVYDLRKILNPNGFRETVRIKNILRAGILKM